MKRKIFSYVIGGFVYFLMRFFFEFIFNREIDIFWFIIEGVVCWTIIAFIIAIILPKILKKDNKKD